jgi:hypothetical protein
MGLAFLCGGLVSAAAFSIGWRHQAQRDNAAQAALAAATAQTHRLEQRVTALQISLNRTRHAAASARVTALQISLNRTRHAAASAAAAEKTLARTGAQVSADATDSNSAAASVSSGTGSVTTTAARIASELKTLDTYLTTTPTSQLDPGYIASQSAYVSQQLTRLQGDAGALSRSVASFEATLHRLRLDANGLNTH